MFNLGLKEMILAGVVLCAVGFIILTALAKRPSVNELLARHDSQREKRDEFASQYFKDMAFRGVIEDINDYMVRTPYREMRYRLRIKPEGRISMPSNAPDTTLVYNFADRDELYFMLGHGQGDDIDEDDELIKEAGKNYFIIKEERSRLFGKNEIELDTMEVSFRLFAPAEDLDPYVDAIRKRRQAEEVK
jgi:hypothetical protein